MKRATLEGQTFSRLRVLGFSIYTKRKRYWKCLCECGKEALVETSKLRSGHTKSCGCLLADKNREHRQTHAHASKGARSLTYKSYCNMITRCENHRAINYERYGGAGITICPRWRRGEGELSGFECFLADMGERPTQSHSIDRINSSVGYQPGNCRWVEGRTQLFNRSNTVTVNVSGFDIPLAVACELTGVKYGTAWLRIKNGHDWRGAQ